MDISSVSEQERQSLEAVSRSEPATFPFDEPESEDVWSSVLFELPATASSSGSVGPLVGLQEGLEGSCLCCLSWFQFLVLNWVYGHCPVCSCAHSQPQILSG